MRPLSIELLIGGGGRGSKLSTIRNGRPASSHRAVFGGPVFRLCGLRFALCPRGFSRFAASDESSTPLLIGLTSRCFVPQFAIVALLRYRLQVSFAHWTSASPVSRTARGEAPSHWARASCAPRHCRPQFAMVVPRRAQSALAALPCSLGLLRPASATGGGLRAPPSSFR